MQHVPVMLAEVSQALKIGPGKIYLDGTVGYGGHASKILNLSSPDGILIGLDRDQDALAAAGKELSAFGDRCHLWNRNYREFDDVLAQEKIKDVDGMLLDLGVSSVQLTSGPRGFSLQNEGPLDMRMDPSTPTDASEIVNEWAEKDLADLFYQFGEERLSRRYARAIVAARRKERISTTGQLATLIARSCPRRPGRRHPATRVFQALRIVVNDELGALDEFLEKFSRYLKPSGRVAILSYHSLEDRRVKQAFRRGQKDGMIEIIHRKPLVPEESEIHRNPRSRSAKLRVAERKELP